MSDDSEALIREIQDEVRRERMTKLWERYGTWLIAGVVGVVVLFAGIQWYLAYRLDRLQTSGVRFEEGRKLLDAEKDKQKDGFAILENLAKEGTPAYAALAKLRLAGAHREAAEAGKALPLYEAVAADTALDDLLRGFANLQIASLKIDTGTWTDVENRLNRLAHDKGPWRHSARELLGLAAYRHQQWAAARQAFTTLLSDPAVPASMRQRAETAMALISRHDTAAEAPSSTGGVKSDLKNDKSTGKAATSSGPGAAAKPVTGTSGATPATGPTNGAGTVKNDAKEQK